MKIYSEFEKRALRKIIKLDKITDFISVTSFLNDIVEIKSQVMMVGHDYDYELKEGENHYYKIEIKGNKRDIPTDSLTIRKRFNELVYLLKYLIENGLVLQVEGTVALGLMINRRDFKETKEIETRYIYLSTTLKQLLELCSYHFEPTEDLKQLVQHNFITSEERNNRKTRKIAIISIVISILGILFNTLFSIFDAKSSKIESISNEIKIDTNSINYYIEKLNSSKLNYNLSDTLKK
jgi:hypothetical protein